MAEAVKLARKAYEAGITFFDTARFYTDSEEKLGAAFDGMRDKVYIATKTGAQTGEGFWADLKTSLGNLRTDYIDIYFYHRDDPRIPVEEMVETMQDFVREGKCTWACRPWL